MRTLREKPEYAVLLPHLPDADSGNFTFEQLSDSRVPSVGEGRVLLNYMDQAFRCWVNFTATVQPIIPTATPILATCRSQVQNEALLLGSRQVSWGAALQRLKAFQEEMTVSLKQIRA
jgi:hypothetical protein